MQFAVRAVKYGVRRQRASFHMSSVRVDVESSNKEEADSWQ